MRLFPHLFPLPSLLPDRQAVATLANCRNFAMFLVKRAEIFVVIESFHGGRMELLIGVLVVGFLTVISQLVRISGSLARIEKLLRQSDLIN